MELFLDIFWEKRRVYIEWKQIVCAVLLAFLIVGLYNYINAQPAHVEKFKKKQAVPAEKLPVVGISTDLSLMPEENIEEADQRRKSGDDPRSAVGGPNFAVSYGYSESETEKSPKSAKYVKKTGSKAIASSAAVKADDRIKHVTEAVQDIPVTDVITGNPDIAAGRKDNDRSVKNEKTGAGSADTNQIAADTNKAEADRIAADTNKAGADGMIADTDRADASNEDSHRKDIAGADADKTDVGGTADADRTDVGGAADADRTDTPDTDKTDTKPVVLVERFPGFLTNEKGHIAGYTDAAKILKDYLVVFPRNAACTGIEKEALKGLEADIYEIYIPANITYIAEGAMDELVNLYYIEAAPGNPRFYSENGILYYRNGEVAVCPNRLKR